LKLHIIQFNLSRITFIYATMIKEVEE